MFIQHKNKWLKFVFSFTKLTRHVEDDCLNAFLAIFFIFVRQQLQYPKQKSEFLTFYHYRGMVQSLMFSKSLCKWIPNYVPFSDEISICKTKWTRVDTDYQEAWSFSGQGILDNIAEGICSWNSSYYFCTWSNWTYHYLDKRDHNLQVVQIKNDQSSISHWASQGKKVWFSTSSEWVEGAIQTRSMYNDQQISCYTG